jgi:hypothetical protein
LDQACKDQQERQHKLYPCRQVEKDVWLDRRQTVDGEVKREYQKLDNHLKAVDNFIPVYFHEDIFLTQPFESPMDRFRSFQKLSLSCDVVVLRYDPDGSSSTVKYLWKVPSNISDIELMTATTRITEALKPKLNEFHTRQMRKDFAQKFSSIAVATIPPYLMRSIYAELTLDASSEKNQKLYTVYIFPGSSLPKNE